MHNIPQEDLEKICQSMKREEGSFSFEYCSKNLMNQENASYLSIFKIVSGNYIFLLERDQNFSLNFYQTSPRKGTRVAAIDLEHISKCEKVFIALTWSPDEICLYLGPKIPGSELVYAKGKLSDIDLCVGSDGNIYFHTSDVIMNLNIMQDGKKILSPSAIKSWSDTKKALEVLWTGKSNEGYMFEVLLANITISMLVTGFEVYTKKRIIELEEGGGNPRTESFFSSSQQEKLKNYIKDAQIEGLTLLRYLVERRIINFQNYEDSKKAFNKIFGIKFGSIGCESRVLEKIQKFITFRHTITHISPLNAIFNELEMSSGKDPIHSNKTLSDEAIAVFDLFVDKLHQATLAIDA